MLRGRAAQHEKAQSCKVQLHDRSHCWSCYCLLILHALTPLWELLERQRGRGLCSSLHGASHCRFSCPQAEYDQRLPHSGQRHHQGTHPHLLPPWSSSAPSSSSWPSANAGRSLHAPFEPLTHGFRYLQLPPVAFSPSCVSPLLQSVRYPHPS